MWKTLSAVALTGWAGIVWLAWHLAGARIASCGQVYDQAAANCIVRAEAARDFTLIAGLSVALIGVVAVLALALSGRAQRSGSFTGWRSTNQADRPLLRS